VYVEGATKKQDETAEAGESIRTNTMNGISTEQRHAREKMIEFIKTQEGYANLFFRSFRGSFKPLYQMYSTTLEDAKKSLSHNEKTVIIEMHRSDSTCLMFEVA